MCGREEGACKKGMGEVAVAFQTEAPAGPEAQR